MKTIFLKVSSVFLFVGTVSLMMTSCSTTKKITPKDMGEVDVVTPCSGSEFQTNSKAFRFSAIGESMDQMTAKKKGMSEARAGLAAAIGTKVKTVFDNYLKDVNYNNKEELMKNYEGMTRETVTQTLAGSHVICEKTTLKKDGTYKYYVCLELGGNDILQSLNNKMTNNEMLKVDYNYEKFKKTFEDEMNKTGN
jgi:outer membrane protein assembly factor BamE (lipoprotein component of BamABCDE complex)